MATHIGIPEYIFIMTRDLKWRGILYEILSQLNYKVTTLPSCNELAGILGKERPDYIITDLDALGFSGAEALRRVREIDEEVKLLILMPASTSAAQEQELALDEGVKLLRIDTATPQSIQHILFFLKRKNLLEDERIRHPSEFKGTILVIDDEEDAAQLICNYLNRRGYRTEAVFSGEEAMVKIKSLKPRVVVLDILMPGMDGLLILQNIKHIDASTVVILTSGLQDEAIIKEAMRLGAAAYLTKPFNLLKLEMFILASIVT